MERVEGGYGNVFGNVFVKMLGCWWFVAIASDTPVQDTGTPLAQNGANGCEGTYRVAKLWMRWTGVWGRLLGQTETRPPIWQRIVVASVCLS